MFQPVRRRPFAASSRPACCTALEPRAYLATDLTYTRTDKFAMFEATAGDPAYIAVEPAGDGAVRVFSRVDTTFGGDTSRKVILGGRRALVFKLNDADASVLTVTDCTLAGGLTINTNKSLSLDLSNSTVVRGFSLNQRSGDGSALLRDSTVEGSVAIDLGADDQEITTDNLTISGRMLLDDLEGNAKVDLTNTSIGGDKSRIVTGAGRDIVNLVSTRFDRQVNISTGDGADRLEFDRVRFGKTPNIDDGAGVDSLVTHITYDFNRDEQGWAGGFADYNNTDITELDSPVAQEQDNPTNIGGKGYYMAGTSNGDRLIMYMTRGLARRDGVLADTAYTVDYTVQYASSAPTNAINSGGAEGEGVTLKVGASSDVPATSGDNHDLNVDIGDQSTSGASATVLGDLANGLTDPQDPSVRPFVKLTKSQIHVFPVTSGSDGSMNLMVAADSGYRGRTEIIYRRIDVTLRATR
ncbi:MAG: hypothetical protein QM770_08210 [Tepidisphaeraceae bacterium]